MKSSKPLIIVLVILVIGVGGVIGYALSHKNSDSTTTMPGMTHMTTSENTPQNTNNAVKTDAVKIQNFDYSPAVISVKKGTKVTWTNQDSVAHTVTSDGKSPASFDSGSMQQGGTFTFTFDKTGTYTYHCQFHPYMKGTVIVTNQ